MMKECSVKRAEDSKSLTSKESTKADVEAKLQAHTEKKSAASKELMATVKYIGSLHSECDWLVQNYDVRKTARAGEVDSLKKAKAILNGADFSLAQIKTRHFLSHPRK